MILPRDVPHTFVAEGETPARMLTLLSPGGCEAMFDEGGACRNTTGSLQPRRGHRGPEAAQPALSLGNRRSADDSIGSLRRGGELSRYRTTT